MYLWFLCWAALDISCSKMYPRLNNDRLHKAMGRQWPMDKNAQQDKNHCIFQLTILVRYHNNPVDTLIFFRLRQNVPFQQISGLFGYDLWFHCHQWYNILLVVVS